MSEHTPGPWKYIQGDDKNPNNAQIFSANDQLIHLRACMNAEDEANARLMAAAPELIAALKALRTALREAIKLDVKKHYHLMVVDAAAGTIIHKAEGGTP